jgi:FlaG/FlaF family flagellin (archaellin)
MFRMTSHKDTFRNDTNAVSEVVAEVLMTAIAVLAFTVIAVFVFSYADSREMVYADIQGWVDTDSDTVYLRHAGGQIIDITNIRIMLNVNGTMRELSPAELLNQKGGSIWQPGEVLSINTSTLWGSNIAPADHISTTIIDVDTNLVIMSGWLTGNTRYMEEGSGM